MDPPTWQSPHASFTVYSLHSYYLHGYFIQCAEQIWGGGLFYHDCVYDHADELGLLMYHDAM